MRIIKSVKGGSRFRFYSTVSEGYTSDEMTFKQVMEYIDMWVKDAEMEYKEQSKFRAQFIEKYYKPTSTTQEVQGE